MAATLDRTELADRLDLIAAVSDFVVATEAQKIARRKIVRLARRIVADPTLTDDEIVPAAYRLAKATRAELAAALSPAETGGGP